MKVKLILLAVTVIAVASFLMAFKQESGHRKYLVMMVSITYSDVHIANELGEKEDKKLGPKAGAAEIAQEVNQISGKGYKLHSFAVNATSGYYTYIFEKE